jgi:hypothetical protein
MWVSRSEAWISFLLLSRKVGMASGLVGFFIPIRLFYFSKLGMDSRWSSSQIHNWVTLQLWPGFLFWIRSACVDLLQEERSDQETLVSLACAQPEQWALSMVEPVARTCRCHFPATFLPFLTLGLMTLDNLLNEGDRPSFQCSFFSRNWLNAKTHSLIGPLIWNYSNSLNLCYNLRRPFPS